LPVSKASPQRPVSNAASVVEHMTSNKQGKDGPYGLKKCPVILVGFCCLTINKAITNLLGK